MKSILKYVSFIIGIVLVLGAGVACDNDIPEPQGYSTPTAKGCVILPDGLDSSQKIYVKVQETGMQYMVSSDGTWIIEGLDKEKTYTLYFKNGPFSDISRSVSVGVEPICSARRINVKAADGAGFDNGVVQLKFGAQINGKVMDIQGNAIADATISIPGSPYITQTSDDGSFVLEGVAEGEYSIRVEKNGYISNLFGPHVILTDDSSARVYELESPLELSSSYGAIQGTVVFEGSTVASGSVTINVQNDYGINRTEVSDEYGSFLIDGLPAGTYRIRITSNGLYRPFTLEEVVVTEGNVALLDPIELNAIGGALTGQVTTGDNKETEGAIVLLSSESNNLQYLSVADSSGHYSFQNVLPGDYVCSAILNGYIESHNEVRVSVGTTFYLNIELSPVNGIISGRVIVSGATNNSEVSVNVECLDDYTHLYSTTTSLDGSFIVAGIRKEGDYRVELSKTGYASVIVEPVSVLSGASNNLGEIVLEPLSATLTGKVLLVGASDFSGISVILDTGKTQYATVTDENGVFYFESLPAGTYTLSFSRDGYARKELNKVIILQSEDKILDDVELEFAPISVTGVVTLEGLSDYSGVSVVAVSQSDSSVIRRAATDSQGQYRLDDMLPGVYRITFYKEGFISNTLDVVVSAGKMNIADFSLQIGNALITGHVGLKGASTFEDITVSAVSLSNQSVVSSAQTMSDGTFIISDLRSEGYYQLMAEKEGYVTGFSEMIFVSFGKAVSVDVPELDSINSRVSGSVLLADRSSHENTVVRLVNEKYQYECMTNPTGSYLIQNVVPGTYTLSASKDGYIKSEIEGVVVGQSTELEMETIQLDLEYLTINGTVALEGSDDCSGVVVVAENIDTGVVLPATVTNLEGVFAIGNIVPGTYRISVEKSGYLPEERNVLVQNGHAASLEISMRSGAIMISGKAVLKGNVDSSGVNVTVTNEENGTESYVASTMEDGSYSVRDLKSEGFYLITAEKDGYISESRLVEALRGKNNVVETIYLVSDDAVVSGRVVLENYSMHDGVRVVLRDGSGIEYETFTDNGGYFTFTGVEAGTYGLILIKEGFVERQVTPVIVAPAGQLVLEDVVLTQVVSPFKGTVSLLDGDVPSSVIVTASHASNPNVVYTVETDDTGSFCFEDMLAGAYEITFAKIGYQTHIEYVTIVAGRDTTLNVTLTTGSGVISGMVVLEGELDDYSGILVIATNSDNTDEKYNTTTQADGSFTITGIKTSGLYLLSISKEGYTPDNSVSANVVQGEVSTVERVILMDFNSVVRGNVKLAGAASHEGILVVLSGEDGSLVFSGTTDEDGDFVISGVVPGITYKVSASKAGYTTKNSADTEVGPSTEVEIPPLVLSMSDISITGTIRLEDADTHGGAIITATDINDYDNVYYAISNDDGIFSFAGMKAGDYSITVSKEGYWNVTLDTVGLSSTSSKINLGIIEVPFPLSTISGFAQLEGASNHSGIIVSMEGTEYSTTTDSDGSYSLSVKAGRYDTRLSYSRENYQTETYEEPINAVVNSVYSIDDVVQLECIAATVRGSIDVLSVDDSDVTVSIEGTGLTCVTDESGEFVFDDVPLGQYNLIIERADAPRLEKPFKLDPCLIMDMGEIEITPNYADLYGNVVLDGCDNYSGVLVTAIADNPQMDPVSTQTLEDGSFLLDNVLSTETYTITFSKDGWESNSTEAISGLHPLETRNVTNDSAVVLKDTIAPVITVLRFGNDSSKTYVSENIPVHLEVEEDGVGLSKMQYCFDNDWGNAPLIDFTDTFNVAIPEDSDDCTIYVRVYDSAGNVSKDVSATVTYEKGILISGELSEDKLVWDNTDSPYLIVGDTIVPEGEELLIKPGVDVQFTDAWILRVNGTVSAIGTEDNHIIIHGVDDGLDEGLGIQLENTEKISNFEYVEIFDMYDGISGLGNVSNSEIGCISFSRRHHFTGSMTNVNLNANKCYFGTVVLQNVRITGTGSGTKELRISNDSVLIDCVIDGFSLVYWKVSFSYNTTFTNISGKLFLGFESAFINCDFTNINLIATELNTGSNDGGFNSFNSCYFENVRKIATGGGYSPIYVRNSNINCQNLKITVESALGCDFRNNYWHENLASELQEGGNISFIDDHYDYKDYAGSVWYSGFKDEPFENAGVDVDKVETSEVAKDYNVGDIGPAGGIIVYETPSNSILNFKYIEALTVEVAASVPFGYYRSDVDSQNQMVGTSSYIGSGKSNTEALVNAMGDEAYLEASGSRKGLYGAKLATMIDAGGYDWYLPSYSEAEAVIDTFTELFSKKYYYGFYYMTSTEETAEECRQFGWGISDTKQKDCRLDLILVRYI